MPPKIEVRLSENGEREYYHSHFSGMIKRLDQVSSLKQESPWVRHVALVEALLSPDNDGLFDRGREFVLTKDYELEAARVDSNQRKKLAKDVTCEELVLTAEHFSIHPNFYDFGIESLKITCPSISQNNSTQEWKASVRVEIHYIPRQKSKYGEPKSSPIREKQASVKWLSLGDTFTLSEFFTEPLAGNFARDFLLFQVKKIDLQTGKIVIGPAR